MPWFRKPKPVAPEPEREPDSPITPPNGVVARGGTVLMPAHLQHIISERERSFDAESSIQPSRRSVLERKRLAIQYDIDQGELASQAENPWTERIALLTEALGTVERELHEAEQVVPGPYVPLPRTPISELKFSHDDGVHVAFVIGSERFEFDEDVDWAERGFQIAEPVLRQTSGEADHLVPDEMREELRPILASHLRGAVESFATELRDRVIDEQPIPEGRTLADLARPCSTCGGWSDAQGHCHWCAERRATAQALFQERTRLLHDRTAEVEERHKIAERLSLARARMANLERELAELDRA